MIRKKCCPFTLFIIAAFIFFLSCSAYAQPSAGDDLKNMSLEDLMSIQVTSVSKKPQNLSDSAAAIFVITNEDLMRSGVTSIPEALRMVPGMQVARIDSNKWAISSRGLNSRFTDKLLVLIDGRTVYTPSFSGVYWEVQDMLLEDLERIEVIRGPGATLWGANAVNGVINIISKHAADTTGGMVSAGGGSVERAFGSARYGAALGKGIYGRIYAKYFDRDEFEYQSGGDAGDDWNMFRTGFRLDSKKTGSDSFTFQGDLYTGDINQRQIGVPSTLPPYSYDVEDDTDVSGGNLLARWQRILSYSSEFTLQAYYDRTNREDLYVYEKRDSFDLDFQHRFTSSDRHELIWGLRYRYTHDDFSNLHPIVEISSDSRGDHLFSAFIQDEISLIEDTLWLILGSKFEHNDYSGYEIQPNGRLLWAPGEQHRFWTAVSRAVRTPSRWEHDVSVQVASMPPVSPLMPLPVIITIGGDEALDSEELIAYEAGYRFMPDSRFSLDFSLFYNDYDKLRSNELAETLVKQGYIEQITGKGNNGDGNIYGLELSAVWQPAEWIKTNLAYHYIKTDMNQGGDFGQESPKHQVSLRAGFTPFEDVDADIWFRYVDDTRNSIITSRGYKMYEIDDYMTLDFRVAWHLTGNMELIAAAQNLLDSGHMEFTQEVLIAPTEVPRSFYGQVRYTF